MRRIRKVIPAFIASVSLATSVAVAAPGRVDAESWQCPNGALCFWIDDNFSGGFTYVWPMSSGNLGSYWEDEISSYWNRSSSPAIMFEHDNFRGYDLCAMPGASSPDLDNFCWSCIEDKISSYKFSVFSDPRDDPDVEGDCRVDNN